MNDGISNKVSEFELHYPFVDSIIQTLNKLGLGASILKVNISHHRCRNWGDIAGGPIQLGGRGYLFAPPQLFAKELNSNFEVYVNFHR